MSRPNQFLSPEGDLEDYFVDEYWLIDQYVGDELWVWGSNTSVQLGINRSPTIEPIKSTPVTTFAGGSNWKQVSGGNNHTAAIKTDGTLWTWGSGSQGQLGNASTVNASTPVTTFSGGTNWRQVSCGNEHEAAIKTDGTLWTWGRNLPGRLGNASTVNASTPVTTFAGGTNWRQVSAGSNHTAAIKTDGTLWIWGTASTGQLGNASTVNVSTPVTTFTGGTNWRQVSAGNGHTAAIKTDGTLWTWGYNSVNLFFTGQLGNNSSVNTSTPVTTFAGGTNWKQVSAGFGITSAIKTDGTLWIWGRNASGQQLGTNDITNRSTPVTTFAGGNNWKQVSCGTNQHTAAIKTDGTLWTWGSDSNGQLGDNTTTNRSTPVTTFAGGTNWKQVSGGGDHTAAVFSGTTPDLPIS